VRRKLATLVFILMIGGRLAVGTESVAAYSIDSSQATDFAAGPQAAVNWQELQSASLAGLVGGFVGGGFAGVGGALVGVVAGAAVGAIAGFAGGIVGDLVTQFAVGASGAGPTIAYSDRALD
jgi:hypothetical protein